MKKLFKVEESECVNDNELEAPDDILLFDREELTETRMLSFQQLYDFNNLCLNKSFLRKRTK